MTCMKSFLLIFFLLTFFAQRGEAKFGWEQTQTVPISRVLTNLQNRLQNDPNKALTLYHLARIHAMAYTTNLTVINIVTNSYTPIFGHPGSDSGVPHDVYSCFDPKEREIAGMHLSNAIAYYHQAIKLENSNPVGDPWLLLRIQLGLAWCIDQQGIRNEAIKAYRHALVLAWKNEFDPKMRFDPGDYSWDQIRARNTNKPPKSRNLGPGLIYSEEVIGYLLKLLDPVKDAKEIAQLKTDQLFFLSNPRAITPLLLPLDEHARLEELVDPAASVRFDLDGSGLQRSWGWINPHAGWIVYDHDNSGQITSGLQMFGNVTFWLFWRDGYEALSALDDNGDGKLTGSELRKISIWQDLNSNGLCDPGEVKPITAWGVVELNCQSQRHPTGIPFNPAGAVFEDGTTRPTFDWIAPSTANRR